MYPLFVILVRTVSIAIDAAQFLMFIRMILSWLPGMEGNVITDFIYGVTELIISPVRTIMEKLNIMQGLPFDMSFMLTYLLLFVVQLFLPVV